MTMSNSDSRKRVEEARAAHNAQAGETPGPWIFGDQSAAIYIGRTANPWERREDVDEWAPRLLLTDPSVLATEAARARQRLEQAIAHCTALLAAEADRG